MNRGFLTVTFHSFNKNAFDYHDQAEFSKKEDIRTFNDHQFGVQISR